MTDDIRTAPEIAFRTGGDVSVVDFVFGTFLHFLRNSDRQTSVHMGFGVVIRHLFVAIPEVIEVIARFPDFAYAHLTKGGGIECSHGFRQDRGDRRGID